VKAVAKNAEASQSARWQRLYPLLERWIPFPRVLHPYPQARFAARHPK
jgi:hypothetical protein